LQCLQLSAGEDGNWELSPLKLHRTEERRARIDTPALLCCLGYGMTVKVFAATNMKLDSPLGVETITTRAPTTVCADVVTVAVSWVAAVFTSMLLTLKVISRAILTRPRPLPWSSLLPRNAEGRARITSTAPKRFVPVSVRVKVVAALPLRGRTDVTVRMLTALS
jgi:hypothetical protein